MDALEPATIIDGLTAFTDRGAGTDAERRAASWLATRCASLGGEPVTETFWCRPNWAAAHLWHIALAVAGSLLSLVSPIAGIVVLSVALVSTAADGLTGYSLGRRLTPERASQNVIVAPPADGRQRTRLVLTAHYDAGRMGLAYKLAPATRRLNGAGPGWLAWVSIAMVWLLAVAILRLGGHTSPTIGAIQLPPTVSLVLGFALLVDLATGDWSPAAGDNASGVALAIAVAAALTSNPPQHLEPELVLTGAGDGDQIGLVRVLRAHRSAWRAGAAKRLVRGGGRANTIVLGIGACAGGTPHWWQSDGTFLPLRYARALRRIAEGIAEDEPYLRAIPHRGRGVTAAFPARMAGLPAIAIGCLDRRGVAPRSHQRSDISDSLDPEALDHALQFALLLIDGIDAVLGEAETPASPTPA